MVKRSPIDDAANSAHAWARYWRILRYLGLFTLGIIAVAFALIYWSGETVTYHFYIAIALGLGFTIMLTGALMGLIFLSNGTGHDEAIEDPLDAPQARRPKSYWQD